MRCMSAITLAEANGLILISKKWTAREQANDQFPEIFWFDFLVERAYNCLIYFILN